jgi:signal transduction histidine kinase
MSPASRRIFAYWLLLLLPTLAVGVGAIQLLRREQARLAEQQAYAGEARLAAATARVGLIVENAELLIGDMQAGLLETLGALPVAGLDAELAAFERGNPLVRTVFRCAPDGRIVRPPAPTNGEEETPFRRRFGPLLESNPPWRAGAAEFASKKFTATEPGVGSRNAGADAGVAMDTAQEFRILSGSASSNERAARQSAYSNVDKVQSARREAQNLAKNKEYGSSVAPALAAAPPSAAAEGASRADDFAGSRAAAAPDRTGWLPWKADDRLHLLGWVEKGALGEVRGLEANVPALIARLAAALPGETGTGEGYALRDEQGRVMHQAGWVPRDGRAPVTRVPLAASALPGWEAAAFLAAPTGEKTGGSGLLLVGSLLTGILIVAILAGGSLLLWQARASEAEAARKTSFVANVSHEFKTPLTTIRLYAELLGQGRVADGAKQKDYLRTIGRETERLARLVGNALDYSRLEQGRKKYDLAALDLRAELAQLLDTHGPRLAEAGLALKRELPAEPLTVATDRDALGPIVLNLLDNAAKYAAAGGAVTVALAGKPGGGATVRVLDRGPGVPAAQRERIFEKFHRVDDRLTAEQPGAGLGLSIARQLARGLGGGLRCEPREGGGACFTLELP